MPDVADEDPVAIRHNVTNGLTTITRYQWENGDYAERGWEETDWAEADLIRQAGEMVDRRLSSLDDLSRDEAVLLAERLGHPLPASTSKAKARKAVASAIEEEG